MTDVQRVLRGFSVGTQLRIERLSAGRAEGALREKHADGVTLANGEVMERIPFLDMKRVWRRATFALPGALAGAVAAMIVGGMLASSVLSMAAAFLAGKALMVIALVVIAVGALLGAAVGAWVPRWVKVWE